MSESDTARQSAGVDHVRRAVVILLILTGLVMLLNVVAHIMWLQDWPKAGFMMLLFDMDQETSIATWYASTQLALQGALVGVMAWLSHQQQKPRRVTLIWLILAGAFFFLSIDEASLLHERVGRQVKLEGGLHHARWMLIWLPPALLFGAWAFWQLWHLAQKLAIGWMIGGAVFLAGAAGVEILNSNNKHAVEVESRTQRNERQTDTLWHSGSENVAYVIGITIEETLELLGVAICIGFTLRQIEETVSAEQ